MIIPGILAQRRAAGVAPTLWTPLNMATVPQIYLDAQDSAVTDVSGACSAISNLGAMGSDGDFSQATAGNRPSILAAELNGKRVLSFDGTNDEITGGTTAQRALFRNTTAAWIFFVYKKRNNDSLTRRIFHASTDTAGFPRFLVFAGFSTDSNKPAMQVRRLDGDSTASLVSAAVVHGVYTMTLHAVNYSTRAGRIYKNGSLDVENTALTAATGSTSDTAAADPLTIGARFGGVVPADVDIAAVVICKTYPSDADIDKLFGWAAHKYGLTANLPSGHPYKTVAPTV